MRRLCARWTAACPSFGPRYTALQLRNAHPEWFGGEAAYTPVYAEGAKKEHVVAYLRAGRVAAVVPRWNQKLGIAPRGFPSATVLTLPEGHWRSQLAGEMIDGGRLRIQNLLARFPVALLVKDGD